MWGGSGEAVSKLDFHWERRRLAGRQLAQITV
jgi:hypothetical protein